jgi:indole-3-glycerol phosphate synthase
MLNRIIAEKREEVAQRKRSLPLSVLKESIAQRKAPLNFASALSGDSIRLIAEIKRASPSRGILCPDFNPVALAKIYAENGAAAISILTEEHHFQGSLDHLAAIREEVRLPLLRKDFILDLSLSRNLGLSCLVEVHNEGEVERALDSGTEIIGINNRNLNTFKVDIDTTHRLRSLIPKDRIVVSESGISTRSDVEKMKKWGVNAVLIGEALVTATDIPAKMRELML